MHRKIHRRAVAVRQMLRKRACQFLPLRRRDLLRQRHLELPCHPRVPAALGRLGGVPERLAVLRPGRLPAIGQDDLVVLDASLAAVVMHLAVAPVDEVRGRAVGRRRDRRAARGPADGFHRAVVDRQGSVPSGRALCRPILHEAGES